ncbi:MAG: pyruvate dehydrogenase complex transcriptional repressor PdhR [Thalassotalea sp.]
MNKAVKQPKLSDIILAQLEELIVEGDLQAGEQLPPERELAKQFEVSRPSLREAIQKLEAKGLVVRKQGGGTFVCDNLLSGLSDPLFDLISKKNNSQLDLLEFRLGVEGMAAYYAATRGTPDDLRCIQAAYDNIEVAQLENSARREAQAVFDFYMAICQASHNAVILHIVRSMASLLIDNLEQNISVLAKIPDVFDKMRSYRKRLMNAILSGKPQKAWSESHNHLTFIEEVLVQKKQEQSSMQRSLQRMPRVR